MSESSEGLLCQEYGSYQDTAGDCLLSKSFSESDALTGEMEADDAGYGEPTVTDLFVFEQQQQLTQTCQSFIAFPSLPVVATKSAGSDSHS